MAEKTLRPKSKRHTLAGWVKEHAITSFILLVFGFSYLVGGAFNIWVTRLSPDLPGFVSAYLPRLLIVAGPAFGALVVSTIQNGKAGARQLLRSLKPQKQHLGWYLLLPILGTVITFSSFLVGGLTFGRLLSILTNDGLLLLWHLVIQVLMVGIGEELGWRGWLLPHLSVRYRLAVAMIFVAIIWGAWHFPILFMGAAVVVPWVLVLLASTVILTWVWLQAKGDILLLAVAHASINFSQFFLENQIEQGELELLLKSWQINSILYLMLAVVLLFKMRKHLPERVISQSE